MKVLACEHGGRNFHLLVNAVTTAQEVEMVFQKLQRATQQFLNVNIYPLGWIPHDIYVQKAVVEMFPNAQASRAFLQLAMAICAWSDLIFPARLFR